MNKRRQREKRSINDNISEGDINAMLHFFEGRCCYCNVTLNRQSGYDNSLELDHYISLGEQDGDSEQIDLLIGLTVENTVPSCRLCNRTKKDKNAIEWCQEYFGHTNMIENIEMYFAMNQGEFYA